MADPVTREDYKRLWRAMVIGFRRINYRLDALGAGQSALLEQGEDTMATHEETLEAMRKNRSATASLLALVNELKAARADPAKFDEIVKEINADTDEVLAAILANTPQAPPAGPVPSAGGATATE